MTAPRVLVTGASGFLGKAVVSRLRESEYQVTELARRSKSIAVDLSDQVAREMLRPWSWDIVINLAGPLPGRIAATDNGWNTIAAHANIALNVCSVLPARWTGRLIHASSMAVYGKPERLPVDEMHPRHPLDAYGMAKCIAEDIVSSTTEEKDLDTWIMRLPGLFSEERHNGALYYFVSNASRGIKVTIDASQPTPWEVLHLDDAVEGIMRAIRSPHRQAGTVNVGYGEQMDLQSMAEKIVARFKSSSVIKNATNFVHPPFCMDIGKARTLINWPPTTFDRRLDHFCNTLSGVVAI